MPLIYHEGYSLGDGAGNNQLLKDTVGWTGKNLLKNTASSQTINGVTFTVNADGSINANGTASAQCSFTILNTLTLKRGSYVMSGCPAGGSNTTYQLFMNIDNTEANMYREYGNGIDITVDTDTVVQYGVAIVIRSGATVNDLTFYPMLRRADIIDNTYEPYHDSVENVVEQVYADNGVLGAKNLLKNTATTQTIRGVTFTVNSDGSVTANGTATGGNASISNWGITLTLPAGKYIFSGCPSGGGANTYALLMQDDPYTQNIFDYGDGVVIDISETKTFHPYFGYVREGVTVSNLTFKPMIRLASDPDDTYQPYAMTNRELTEKGIGEQHTITGTTGTTGNWALPYTISAIRRIEAYAKGYIVIPFVNAEGNWFFKVLSIDMQPVASQNIEVTYWTFAV